jgi:ATP phosphoribosyltransferase regulatory subunit
MALFPYYRPHDIAALNAQAVKILGLFAERGYGREEPAVLQPAEIFLDRSGEEIRRRTYTLTDLSGRELCLRPDLTIPICRHAVQTGAKLPARICYNGPVFRHEPRESAQPTQFFQAGAELLGLGDAASGEAEILSLCFEALRVAGLADFQMVFGDLSLFAALADALDLPLVWRERLKRHFWRVGYVEAMIGKLSEKVPARLNAGQIALLLEVESQAPLAGRSRAEIMERALAREADAARTRPDGRVLSLVAQLFKLSGPAQGVLAEARALLGQAGIVLDGPLAAMEQRLEAIAQLGLDPGKVRFTAHFGRNMEYYTGFVFELWAGPVKVAGGGRYDTLMQSLGAPAPVSAVGCAISTEALLASLEGEAA